VSTETPTTRKRLVHLAIREDLYLKLWEIVKQRYPIPQRKLGEVVNEALEKFIKSESRKAVKEVKDKQ
jgi:hypothetical protein